ncbi:hypothetical protein [Paenibacillus sp. N3.4]|uniref:hypothetical protein n=1 Tax=Paenibacillus sp. N3.4 TaxID=2603222 RepID=UPI0011C9835E|nr:hypothetical protein [Paenibacillus sp. N3.4]TXK85987.1 hypothetical protein FU659_00585 [Paenibacillus sp. N3.4]
MSKSRTVLLWLLFPLVGLLLSSVLFPLAIADSHKPHAYTYAKLKANNGVVLHVLQTKPDNIALRAIDQNVTKTAQYGINGGFFYNGDLLSIAVTNDRPAKGEANDYGTGWYNTDVARGTLIWDQALRAFYIQVVKHAGELKVTDRNHYWAQGGVSMRLADAIGWEAQMIAEEMPAYDENRLRSAVAYDTSNHVWLIVTPTACTIEQFRSAILQKVAPGQLIDGVFLDGDGSSQLKSRQHQLQGDGREVYQMLEIVK